MKKILVLLGALALTFTLATAEGKCGGNDTNKTVKKCNGAKCDSSKKDMKKCNGSKADKKKAPAKGKCGQGKCG